ncbi:enterochelin esterase family protein [Azospirillum agricola]|uniref:alpha/beta hydrolase-fold protein n=1 Tax=Azospirillum agricola TaxID=1720247 RepID=UPI001EEB7DBB|nr:alpha/beta hydrolase-fold protein [Azospirillum agricola]MBP2227777.1 enterochelin esterase family protein [Azospirillum agricola]
MDARRPALSGALLVALMLGLIPPAAGAGAPVALDSPVAASLSGTPDGGTHPLALAEGDYVEGLLDSGPLPVDLRLVDAGGRPLRLLLGGSTGRASFRFVAEPAHAALRISGREAGAYSLTLTRRIGRDGQFPNPRVFDSPTIAALAGALERGGTTDAFWERVARTGTPLTEPHGPGTLVMTFLARGARQNVRLLGGPSSDHEQLERLGTSDVWFKSFVVPDSTRLSYQIAPDVPDFPASCRACREAILAQTQADPLNPRSWPSDAPDRFNRWSVVDLPAAPPQPGVPDDAAPAGSPDDRRFDSRRFDSRRLGNSREVTIHTTAGFDPARPDTILLLLFDGPDYRDRVRAPAILDRLTADGRLPPVVTAFIANPSAETRARELPGNPDFAAMLADELLPWLAERTGLTPRPERTVLAGSSYGGLAAATAALAHPERFGNALSISGSFWWHPEGTRRERPEHVAGLVATGKRAPVRFFLSAGLFESGSAGDLGILESSRHLRDVLEAKGYDVAYREYAAGHDYYAWRGVLGDGLLALFGRDGAFRESGKAGAGR